MPSDQMVVSALGRPFTLGMFYDVRKDELVPGFTLWDKETLQDYRKVSSQHSSNFQITASDSIESKSSLLDVEASLKASFLSGLIEVGGSAKYLNDQKKFKNQSRVTLQYKATTHFEQLTMTHSEANRKLKDSFPDKGSATHVVTGILYGANAFFVFDSQKLDVSSVQDIQDNMEAVIKKIPSFNLEGKVGVKLTEEEKALTNNLSCKFYGDFILESNPATFADAVKTYVELPKLLGENGEHNVPVKVWLTPLEKYNLKAAELKAEICPGLLWKAENTLENVKEIIMRCNDSLEERVMGKFPQVKKNFSSFQKLCSDYTLKVKHTMEKKFPSIRAGQEDGASVEKVFDDRQNSPFSDENLTKWLENKEKEIAVIQSCVDIMKGSHVKIVSKQLQQEVFAAGVDHALCFVFTSIQSTDPYLDQVEKFVHSHDGIQEEVSVEVKDLWYSSDEVRSEMRKKAKAFRDLAQALKNTSRIRFLITVMENEKYKGATIYHYKEGNLVTDDFSKPPIPDAPSVTDRRDLIWYASDLILDPKTVSNWLVLSEGNTKATCGPQQSYPDCPDRFDPRPQVLCREGLTGRHYWEVEWSNLYQNDVGVAVTYKRIGRKGDQEDTEFGSNNISWYFGEKGGLCAWHNGQVWRGSLPSSGSRRYGVYLDWPAGTLTLYSVSSNILTHLYTFHERFTEPLYPGFWVWHMSNYISFCPV